MEGAPPRPRWRVEPIVGDDGFVLDVARSRGRVLVGFKGGGALLGEPGGPGRWVGLGSGLRSGIARFVLPDPRSDRVTIGTDRGVVVVTATEPTIHPVELPWAHGSQVRAGPGAVSPADGTVLFQTEASRARGAPERIALWRLRDGAVERVEIRDSRFLGASALLAESTGGFLVGAVLGPKDAPRAALLELSGSRQKLIPLSDVPVGGSEVRPLSVRALAREPRTRQVVVALELAAPGGATGYGVFRVGRGGALVPFAKGLAPFGAEVTALAFRDDRLLVATFGRGLWESVPGELRRLGEGELPGEVTALDVDASGSILAGTTTGVYERRREEERWTSLSTMPGAGPVDAVPADSWANTVIAYSYADGLPSYELRDARWHHSGTLRPGKELPSGLLGDTSFEKGGRGVRAILLSRGVLALDAMGTRILGTEEGLVDTQLLRLLTLTGGDLLVSHAPLPFRNTKAFLQRLRDDRPLYTVELPGREAATISTWLEVPERRSVFAATRAGVLEIHEDGAITKLSTASASAISRDAATGEVGVAGTQLARWSGDRFEPVRLRRSDGPLPVGSPVDLAISRGTWWLLLAGGHLVEACSDGRVVSVLEDADGIPSTTRKLFALPGSDDLFIGSTEGVVVLRPVR